MIYEKWKDAYEKAEFYNSEQNNFSYWNAVAEGDGGGLQGKDHVYLLLEYLTSNRLLNKTSKVLDIGCGGGDYTVEFAANSDHVTALDYSEKMLWQCEERCDREGIENVSFVHKNFWEFQTEQQYDCVISCLNPATYNPMALDKMLSISKGCVVYFSMDTDTRGAENEPIYQGCNSVRFAEEYLAECGKRYEKLEYKYVIKLQNGLEKEIPFAYLVIV
ncbi:MAG: class I SAM-dependent methyltransferase [Eubacterium sp.]|nr:class I SAM-dependent methyltransferase [Eubacterium sp.]